MTEYQLEETIRKRATHDPGFAIAYAILQLAHAQHSTAFWVKNLGNADAATPMGAIEALGKVIKDGMDTLAVAIDGAG